MPEGALAVGASVSDGCDLIYIEVYCGFADRSALGEDLDSAALAAVGALVRERLDLSGDESLYQDFPP